jgi:hypothetical protein
MAAPFPTVWTCFGHAEKVFHINNLYFACEKCSFAGHVAQGDLTGY